MTNSAEILKDRFEGCLFGLAVGDALGGKFEAQSADAIRARFPTAEQLIAYPQEEIWYTDDTQMTIGVSEALIERGEIVEANLCRAFVANYIPSRGYGRGARAVLDAMEDGRNYKQIAEQHFPGGSFGNGAAMRAAPVGLLFRYDHRRLWDQARLSALPTHLHPLGIEGAQLLALAVALCTNMEYFDRADFFARLLGACESAEYRSKMEEAVRVQVADELAGLGNRIEALHSVPTAIACFALTPESFEATVSNAIFLGGDTDTIASMAGALSGAYLGAGRLPARLVGFWRAAQRGESISSNLPVSCLLSIIAAWRVADCISAEQIAAADRAAITAFRDMKPISAARLLSFGVRRRGRWVNRASRCDRLATFVARAKALIEFARPTTAYLLLVLDALLPNEIEELGKWELDKPKTEDIVDRLTIQLGVHRQVVRETLSRCLQFDVWGDNLTRNEVLERKYRQSGETDASIERILARPPEVYSFVHHFIIEMWQPDQENLSELIIEDNRWGAICEGYLVARGRAFPTTLALLEATVSQEWPKWQSLWEWF